VLDYSDRAQNRRWLRWFTPWRLIVALTAAWTVGFAVRGVLEYVRFHTHAFDLGIFAQGTWLLSQFKEPFVTLRGLTLFADHSSYILVLVAPIYALVPSAGTLIVLTVVALGLSAPIAFALARRAGAGPYLSSITAALVLLSPAVQWQIHAAFHPEIFAVPLCLGAIALVQRDRNGWAIAAIALSLTVKEDVGLLVVPLGLAVAFIMGKRRVGFIFAVLGALAFLLNFFVLLPAWSPTGELLYSARYGYLGDSPLGIVWGLMTSPSVWWDTIASWDRIRYVAALVLAMPLCLLAWRWLFVGIPVLAANVLSLHWYQYRVQSHYTAYLIVVVVLAAAYGAARFERFGPIRFRRTIIATLLVVPVLVWAIAGPISVWAPAHEDSARIVAMLEYIPSEGSVSATTTFTPQLANRERVFVFPNPWIAENYGARNTVPPDPSTIEWVAIRTDVEVDWQDLVDELVTNGEYSIVYEDPPFLLLHRSPSE
jgi:uncharacterized membrane protein